MMFKKVNQYFDYTMTLAAVHNQQEDNSSRNDLNVSQ